MLTEEQGWVEELAGWLVQVVALGVPVLGICFGHQLLAQALGGSVGDHPGGGEFGTVTVRLTDKACSDPLFGGLPADFPAQLFHRQSVLHLPVGAQVLAASLREPHQAVRFAERAWGVQFHPEFDAEIMASYLSLTGEQLSKYGFDPAALRQGLRTTPVAQTLLQRFSNLMAGSTSLRSNYLSVL
jgi:GMP synthase (glutamine-hydrolysing)